MVLVEDGKGTGIKVGVNKAHQLNVHAITNPFLQYESEANGNAYTWCSGIVSGSTAGDTILLLKNTSVGLLHIDRIDISCLTAEIFTVHIPSTVVTVTGTTVSGVNLNSSSGNIAEASAASDETDNTQGSVLSVVQLAANSPHTIDVRGLFLDKNKSLAVDVTTGGINVSCTIYGHYIKDSDA
jgi:hypothetical protein